MKTKWRKIVMVVLGLILYVVIMGVYSGLMLINQKTRDLKFEHLGWINSLIIGITDLVLIYQTVITKSGITVSPLKVSFTLIISRIILCFEPTYWIIMQSLVFLIFIVLFGTIYLWKNIPVDSKNEEKHMQAMSIYSAIS